MSEKAAVYLEGGLRTTFKTFQHSGGPCARGLSVAGFLATMGRFPLGGTVISEVRKALFLRGEAVTVDARNNTVIPGTNMMTVQ